MTSEFKLFTLVIRFLRKAINALIKMYGEGSSKKRESHKRSLALGGFEFLEARLVLSADPLLVQNNPLMVAPAGSGTITSSLLATSDADNTAAELTYSITTLPAQGTLKKNGAVAGWLVNPANGHYYRSGVPSSWTDANAEATALGGYLVSIQNGAENQWLLEHFAGIGQGWIGFTDNGHEGSFTWTNGQPVTFTNFKSGEPNGGGSENFVQIYLDSGQWNDLSNSDRQIPGIIERNDATGLQVEFTQDDINSGLISYQHYADSYSTQANASDSFVFTVSDPNGGTVGPLRLTLTPVRSRLSALL